MLKSTAINSTLHHECLLCSTKLSGQLISPNSNQLVEDLVKFLYFYPIPLKSCQESFVIKESKNREMFYETLFHITSLCDDCLVKVHYVQNGLKQFEMLQEELKTLQADIKGLLNSCSNEDADKDQSLMNFYRITVKQELEIARSNGNGIVDPKSKVTSSTKFGSRNRQQNKIKAKPGPRQIPKDPASAYVRLVRLEDSNILTVCPQNKDMPTIIEPLKSEVAIKEELTDYPIPNLYPNANEDKLDLDYDGNNSDSGHIPSPSLTDNNNSEPDESIYSDDFGQLPTKKERPKKKRTILPPELKERGNQKRRLIHKPLDLPCQFSGCSYLGASKFFLGDHVKEMHLPLAVAVAAVDDGDSVQYSIDSKFLCKSCGLQISITTPSSINSHLATHENESYEYKCISCPKKYGCIQSLDSHFRVQHGQNASNTQTQRGEYKDSKSFSKLLSNQVSQLSTLDCKYCEKSLPISKCGRFWSHLKSTHSSELIITEENGKIRCSYCNKCYKYYVSLGVHLINTHTAKVLRNKEVEVWTTLDEDCCGDSNEQVPKFRCNFCINEIIEFDNKTKLWEHLKNCHQHIFNEEENSEAVKTKMAKEYLSNWANEVFLKEVQPQGTETTKIAVENAQDLTCPFCIKKVPYKYQQLESLQKHIKSFHSKSCSSVPHRKTTDRQGLIGKLNPSVRSLASLDCNYCSESFPTIKCGQFWLHLRQAHSMEIFKIPTTNVAGKIQCPFCEIALTVKSHDQSVWSHVVNRHSSIVLKNWRPEEERSSKKEFPSSVQEADDDGMEFPQNDLSNEVVKVPATTAPTANKSDSIPTLGKGLAARLSYNIRHLPSLDCNYCSTTFPTIKCGQFYLHLRKQHSMEIFQIPTTNITNEKLQCPFCEKILTIKGHDQSVWCHMVNRHPNIVLKDWNPKEFAPKNPQNTAEDRPFICEHCASSFCTESDLRKHIRNHNGEFDKPCPFCPRISKGKKGLESHLLTHHPIEAATQFNLTGYKCDYDQCNQILASTGALRVHKILRHTKEFKFHCHLCDFKCLQESRLKYHVTSFHLNQRDFTCDYCKKTFYRRSLLNKHLKIHTNDKPFLCKYCGKGFISRTALKRHEPIHQTTERPFQCKLCDSKFPTRNNLSGHLRSHHKNGTERIGIKPKRKSKYDD